MLGPGLKLDLFVSFLSRASALITQVAVFLKALFFSFPAVHLGVTSASSKRHLTMAGEIFGCHKLVGKGRGSQWGCVTSTLHGAALRGWPRVSTVPLLESQDGLPHKTPCFLLPISAPTTATLSSSPPFSYLLLHHLPSLLPLLFLHSTSFYPLLLPSSPSLLSPSPLPPLRLFLLLSSFLLLFLVFSLLPPFFFFFFYFFLSWGPQNMERCCPHLVGFSSYFS